jgi:hypothetical protein
VVENNQLGLGATQQLPDFIELTRAKTEARLRSPALAVDKRYHLGTS